MTETQSTNGIENVIVKALLDPEVGWSMGSFGALAEFHQDPDEPAVSPTDHAMSRATDRGAIRLNADAVASCTPVAYQQLAKNRQRWGQGMALCLAEGQAQGARRSALTQLGPDNDAIRESDRGAFLFDMGLDLQQCDFCIRTRDAELISVLVDNEGRSLFDSNNPAMGAILRHHPHRVALTPLGRIEVFQKIGGPDTGGKSPPGPHTHVLPNLMRAKKTHAANITVPDGLTPCAYLHPGNPLVDGLGQPRAYRADLATAFAELFRTYAPEDLKALKSNLGAAIAAGTSPDEFSEPSSRAARLTLRVGLRQLAQSARHVDDQKTLSIIQAWLERFDGAEREDDSEPDEQVEHGR
ncbi:MAG: hypothetical protein AAF290_17440 [Pseudomonadota bacterium]